MVQKNFVKLVISDIDHFFDASTRRLLPHSNCYWLELDFFYDNKFKLKKDETIVFYTQYFFSHSILEWRNQSY